MKNTILLDTGVLSLYIKTDPSVIREFETKKKQNYYFISSELNYIELFNHICKEKSKISAQIILENLRKNDFINFIHVNNSTSILAGELKCKYHKLSMVDSVIIAEALVRKIFIYTTETHFSDVENLKTKKFDF
jgi:predicted nucleic acid-binding protein